MSSDKFVPELGEWCEGTAESGTFFKCRILGIFQGPYPEARCVVFQYEDGGIEAATEGNCYTFRPIKSEAEKRREAEIAQMYLDATGESLQGNEMDDIDALGLCESLIGAGWVKPKPLTYEAIDALIIKHQDESETLSTHEFARMVEAYIRGEVE